jgi:hypothetical protein
MRDAEDLDNQITAGLIYRHDVARLKPAQLSYEQGRHLSGPLSVPGRQSRDLSIALKYDDELGIGVRRGDHDRPLCFSPKKTG